MDDGWQSNAALAKKPKMGKLNWTRPNLISDTVAVDDLVAPAPQIMEMEDAMDVDDVGGVDAASTIIWEPKMLKDLSQAQWMMVQK